MAHPLLWPGKYFFYPLGNTSAMSMTRDLSPEQDADILLLGCGDPRSILQTVYNEPDKAIRKLDFTCCDIEMGVLARNALLLTMISDKIPQTAIWNIFYHMHLDKSSHSTLVAQCAKLIAIAADIKSWNASPYGKFLRMCTEYTLEEMRRHWQLYSDMETMSTDRRKAIKNAFEGHFEEVRNRWKNGNNLGSARSSGPLTKYAVKAVADQFNKYWKFKGLTFSNPKEIAAASIINPTFAFSLGGEGCNVHYGTDPLTSFHLAALFGTSKRVDAVTAADAVNAAKSEFDQWCSSYYEASKRSTHTPVVRFFLGEATAVCRTLDAFATSKVLTVGVPVAQWKTRMAELSPAEYISKNAPSSFNVIDSSNLNDHIGLLNVLVAAVPLLSSSPSSLLYTESLVSLSQNATKEFSERLYADITAIGILLGVCPIDYLSGFSSRSNTHELEMHKLALKDQILQFHEVTTWRYTCGGDNLAIHDAGGTKPPLFDARQLGTFLYDMYHQIFEHEDSSTNFRKNEATGNTMRAIASANIIHYIRESFVLFLKVVKNRLALPPSDWREIMTHFFNLHDADTSMAMDTLNYQDFCAQLLHHSVHTVGMFSIKAARIGMFAQWDTIPDLVRIVLLVPRNELRKHEAELDACGTPLLECGSRGPRSHNLFSHLHVAFGSVLPTGTAKKPGVMFREDPAGWRGESPLVVSFITASSYLTHVEDPSLLNVVLHVRSTWGTVSLIKSLGLELVLFSAKLMDKSHVFVLPELTLPPRTTSTHPAVSPLSAPSHIFKREIGSASKNVAALDEQCELVTSLTARVSVEDEEAKMTFRNGFSPLITQVSPCVMKLSVGNRVQHVAYPFPVIGSEKKLRLARKSLYIEIVVPVAGPLKAGGMRINPFPVLAVDSEHHPALWNIHRLNLLRLPSLDLKTKHLAKWLETHLALTMSNRELSLRKNKATSDVIMMVKNTMHGIFVRAAGTQVAVIPERVFSLQNSTTANLNSDTIIFVDQLKFDLDSHTIVADAYVLPLTQPLMKKLVDRLFPQLMRDKITSLPVHGSEIAVWKQLLPALAERCRTWTHGPNCEYKATGEIPLTQVMEQDPLCSCGRGKNVEGMHKVPLWSKFAPYVTRIALSPLFAVSYLEQVGRDPEARKCFRCRGKGKPKIMECTGCNAVRYCSKDCQKKDWKSHKAKCKKS